MKASLIKGNTKTQHLINQIKEGLRLKTDVSEELGISRPTLDKRIESDMWKKTELACIKMLY